MRFPHNRTHLIAVVSTPEGQLPFLFVDSTNGGAVMMEQVALVRNMAAQGYSPSQQLKLTESIGRFFDWVTLAEKCSTISMPDYLQGVFRRFLVARYNGTVQSDGGDPTGLYWLPAKNQTVEMDRRHLNKFSDFVARTLGYFPLNPHVRIAKYREDSPCFREVDLLLSSRSKRRDMFSYLSGNRKPAPTYAVGSISRQRPQREDDAHAFPIERIGDLIDAESSVVKRMIYIELAFGGVRISEALNHFITDVLPGSSRQALFPDDRPSELPLVVLADPIESIYTDSLMFSSEDRRQYLKRRYNLIPRPSRPRRGDPLHAGWKGMIYDNDNLLISQVYWSHKKWAETYLHLFRELLDIRRSVPNAILQSHPYLYICDSPHRAEFGLPIKIHTIEKAFVRVCERIGLIPYRSKVSLHGLRHAYKRQLRLLNVKPSTVQRCMHHSSPDSQDLYDKATSGDINSALLAIKIGHDT